MGEGERSRADLGGNLGRIENVGESAIVIQVPELSDVLRPWRKATEAKGVPPHVTLLYPWRQAPLRAVDIEQLRLAIASTRPFAIRFVAIERFPARALYLKIEEESRIRGLMRKIYAAFTDTPPYGGEFSDIVPHLTIALADTDAELDRVLPQLFRALAPYLPLAIQVQIVAAMEEDESGIWHTKIALPLIPAE
jgi:2'-5' RNA ligase